MSFEMEGLDHVALTVSDVHRSAAWYEDVLGLERLYEDAWQEPVFVVANGTGLALFGAQRSDPAPPPDSHPEDIAMWHVAFRVDRANFRRAQDDLRTRAIAFRFSDHGISHSIYLRDPDGHIVELTTYEI